MNYTKKNGMMLIYAIVAITLAGTALFIFTNVANNMAYDSRISYLNACRRNLAASGSAWIRQNRAVIEKENTGRQWNLDIKSLDIPKGYLNITMERENDTESIVTINTNCTRGKMTLQRRYEYQIRHGPGNR